MRSLPAVAPLIVLLAGCYDNSVYEDLIALTASRANDTSSSSGAETTGTGGFTSSDGSGSASDSATTGTTTTDTTTTTDDGGGGEAEGDTGPQLFLEVTPTQLYVAGPLTFAVEHSADVERLALFEGDDEEPTLEWLAGDPPPPLLVTRGEFTEVRTFVVRGYDEDDNVGTSNQAFVQLLLPPSGALLWEKTFDVGAHGAGRAATSGTIVDEPSIIVGFDKNTGARVGRYTPEGEPQMITAPSAAPTSSTLNGVALDSAGQILAVGVDTVNGVKRPWLVRVNPHTAATLPLFTGKAGEVATGCAFDPKSGRIYVSGYSPDTKKMRPDARIWAFSETGSLVWTKTWERPVQPNEKGDPIDVAFAVAVLENGDPVIVGESQYDPPEPALPLEVWAFVRRYNPDGSLDPDKSWTSHDALDTAGARAVTSDHDNGLLVAGWSSVAEDAPQQATVFAFGALLKEAEIYMAEALDQPRVARGVARLQTGELVLAMDVNDENMAEVRAVAGYFGPPEWIHGFQGDLTTSEIGALSLTTNGHILVVGTRSTPGANTMFLATLHP